MSPGAGMLTLSNSAGSVLRRWAAPLQLPGCTTVSGAPMLVLSAPVRLVTFAVPSGPRMIFAH